MLTLNRTLLRPLVKFLGCIRSAQSEKLALLVVVHCVFFLKTTNVKTPWPGRGDAEKRCGEAAKCVDH